MKVLWYHAIFSPDGFWLPNDHVHLVAARDERRTIEQVVAVLKARATSQMGADGTHPMRAFLGHDGRAPTP